MLTGPDHCGSCGAELPLPVAVLDAWSCPQCGKPVIRIESDELVTLLEEKRASDPAMLASPSSPMAVDYLGSRRHERGERLEEKRASDPAMLASPSSPMVIDYLGSRPRRASGARGSFLKRAVFIGALLATLALRYLEVLTWSWWIVVPTGMATAAIVTLVVAAIFRK